MPMLQTFVAESNLLSGDLPFQDVLCHLPILANVALSNDQFTPGDIDTCICHSYFLHR